MHETQDEGVSPDSPTQNIGHASSSISDSSPEGSLLRVNRTRRGVRAKPAVPVETNLAAPELYFNRELSTLQFHIRVLEQALDPSHPLLNRLMFLLIFSGGFQPSCPNSCS